MLSRNDHAAGAGATLAVCAVDLLLIGGLLASLGLPVTAELTDLHRAQSVTWYDRNGSRLAEEVSEIETRREPVPLSDMSPYVVQAVLSTEDARFYEHHGIDLLATARAAWQNLWALEVVSGGSTITQQLARLLRSEQAMRQNRPPPRRSLWQKLCEARLAIGIEQQLDKPAILTELLNRAPFGNTAVGIEAAARRYFDTTAGALSLAQAAHLAGLPKGPSTYNPLRHPKAAQARQHYVLNLMYRRGMISGAERKRAMAEPIRPGRYATPPVAVHAINTGREQLQAAGLEPNGPIALTIDSRLTAEVEQVIAAEVPKIYARGGRSGAVVVIDNATGEVRVMVGAAFETNPQWGQFNAATAVRQPGSALKPFLYAAALARGATAASLAADIERPFPDTWGIYQPENYDRELHGPVRYREALAQSLNVAAVDVLYRTGLERVFTLLDAVGLKTLNRRASYFGLGLALGSGGVRLVDLTNAYAALARGGLYRPWRILRDAAPVQGATRVIDERVAFIVADIISDPNARIPQFGMRSVLNTPYWTGVKTGTSKGFRDNWTVGFTQELTVGVWVGDPTGQPMRQISGVQGAGTIWRKVMNRLTGYRSTQPQAPPGIREARICHTSGKRLGPHCPGGLDELFVAGTEPQATCDIHRQITVDPANGWMVPPGCRVPGAKAEVAAVYPSPFDAWAEANDKGRAERFTPACPLAPNAAATVALLSPAPTETVRIDPDAPRQQQALPLLAEARGHRGRVTFLVDGEPFQTGDPPYVAYWPIREGRHRIQARLEPLGTVSETHWVEVY